MLPSSGLFAVTGCPFLRSGLCERPHCIYKHAKDERDMFGALCKSPVADFAGQCNLSTWVNICKFAG